MRSLSNLRPQFRDLVFVLIGAAIAVAFHLAVVAK